MKKKMRCNQCRSKKIKIDLRMTTYVGPYKYAYICPNECKEQKEKEQK